VIARAPSTAMTASRVGPLPFARAHIFAASRNSLCATDVHCHTT
jgi:hypothetical protein